jgi:high-affinity Fe2+/Pb2+ permease
MKAIEDMKQFRDEMYRLELIRSSGAMLLKQDLRSMRTYFLAAGAVIAGLLGFFVYRMMVKNGVRLDLSMRAIPA